MDLRQAIDQLSAVAQSLQEVEGNPYRNVLTRDASNHVIAAMQSLSTILEINETQSAYPPAILPTPRWCRG